MLFSPIWLAACPILVVDRKIIANEQVSWILWCRAEYVEQLTPTHSSKLQGDGSGPSLCVESDVTNILWVTNA